MLLLREGETQNIVVTLNEKKTLSSPHYLFVFTHVTTKEVVAVIRNSTTDDLSPYPGRYNEFIVDATIFPSLGSYLYHVYEQTSDSNTNPEGLHEVENGKMNLQPSQNFTYKKYQPATAYKTYAG